MCCFTAASGPVHLSDLSTLSRLAPNLPLRSPRRSGRVDRVCDCGNRVTSPSQEVICRECGALCCPSCSFALASARYCARCAESMLDADGVPLSLSASARISPQSMRAGSPNARPSDDIATWIILVARDQPDLFAHLVRAFARDMKVEIVLDRRKDYRRNPPGMEDRLRTHGAAVIRRRL